MSRRKRVLLGVVGTVAVVAMGGCVSCSLVAGSAWTEFVPAQEARVARAKARQGSRAPLVGPSRPGNAFTGYDRVADDLKKRPGVLKDDRRHEWMLGMVQAADASVRMRAAAGCDRAEFEFDWSRGMSADLPGLLGTQYAANALVLAARLRRQTGNVDGAIDDLAACLQLGSDVARVPTLISGMIGVAVARAAQDELRWVVRDRRTTPAQLGRVRGLLEAFDAQFASARDMLDSEAAVSLQSLRGIVEGRPNPLMPPLALRALAWKHGFSSRGLVAEMGRDFDGIVEATDRAERTDRAGAKAVADTAQERAKDSGYLSRMMLPGLVGVERTVRELRARSAMLRAAILVREGKDATSPEWPADPFTLKPLGFRDEADGRVIWSAWRDGPGTGKGGWKPSNGGDVVLRIRK